MSWVNFKERQPTQGKKYWVLLKDEIVEMAYWFGGSGVFGKSEYHCFLNECVSHWAEIPEPTPPPIPRETT